jgi:hypothetical protein
MFNSKDHDLAEAFAYPPTELMKAKKPMPKAERDELLSSYETIAATLDATNQYRVLRRLTSRGRL